MKALVCGGRDFNDVDFFAKRLSFLDNQFDFDLIIHGGARGADTMADMYADLTGTPKLACRADWNKLGKRAGIIRNQRMLDEQHPDLVVAFPGSRGTAHMVKIARNAGVPVFEHKRIAFYKEHPDWAWMSNFYPLQIVDHDGIVWPTSEHYYQSRKTLDRGARARIRAEPTPLEAKRRASDPSKTPPRHDWLKIRESMMRETLALKFIPGFWLTDLLLDTGVDYLLEKASWDSYWGSGPDGNGLNRLGHLLMDHRDDLRDAH